MQAEGWRLDVDDLKRRKPPFVVFWKFSHFLVVDGFRKGRVYLNDPASGPRWVTEQEFGEDYTGVVLLLRARTGVRARRPAAEPGRRRCARASPRRTSASPSSSSPGWR